MVDVDGALLSPEAVAADPCPHGATRELCGLLCGDPVAVVDPGRPVGFALALDCQLAGDDVGLLSSLTWISPGGRQETTQPYDYRPHLGGRDTAPPPAAPATATMTMTMATDGDDDAPPF